MRAGEKGWCTFCGRLGNNNSRATQYLKNTDRHAIQHGVLYIIVSRNEPHTSMTSYRVYVCLLGPTTYRKL